MSRITSTAGSSSSDGTKRKENDLRDVSMDQFLQLMIAEMQNQDPLNPLDNSEMLAQISQIREIGATNMLTETLQQVLTGQGLTTASSLIGKSVKALTDDAKEIEGVVERVSVEVKRDKNGNEESRSLKVLVNGQKVSLDNVRDIVGAA